MKLYIDSTINTLTTITIGKKTYTQKVAVPRDQDIFKLIVSSLNLQNLNPTDITAIQVNPGPGAFTSTRIGVSIANALAFALGIPVNNQEPPVEPIYSSPPNITVSKAP